MTSKDKSIHNSIQIAYVKRAEAYYYDFGEGLGPNPYTPLSTLP